MPAPRFSRRPRPQHRSLTAGVALGLVCLVTACAAQTSPPSRPGVRDGGLEAETALRASIAAEIGAATCNSDAQCRLLPLGAKACGGPEGWAPWSTATSQAQRLQGMADELAALQRQRIQARGLMSNCRYEVEPGVACVAQRCVLQPGGDVK